MSLLIDVDEVTDVLLADGWHAVKNVSFDLDAYEFHYGGADSTGFRFLDEEGSWIMGPITSLLAVKTERP